jgi:hypothetical protein
MKEAYLSENRSRHNSNHKSHSSFDQQDNVM